MSAEGELAFVALGSNLGDRAAYLARARAGLASLAGTTFIAASGVEETAPLGGMAQPPYLNQMVLLRTRLAPRELLGECQRLEREAGRVRDREARWAPRTLDLDIVLFGERHISEPGLVIPHPGLPARDFWQRELAELRTHEH